MNIFDRAKAALKTFKGSKSTAGIELIPGLLGFGGEWYSPEGVDQPLLMKKARHWAWKASKVIADVVGTIHLRIYQVNKDGSWDEIESHPLLDLLHRANNFMTRFELFETTSMHLDFSGNAYWLLVGVEREGQAPTAIWPLNPRFVKVKPAKLPEFIAGYTYRTGGAEPQTFQPYQILHFRETNPNDPYMGLGPVEAVIESVDSDEWAREWNRRFFANSARPDLVLKANKQMSERDLDYIRERFEDKYRGYEKAHKAAILPVGVEIDDKMGFSQKDMDFVEQLKWSRDEIISAFRVPHQILGLGAGENLNRATADALNYVFSLYTVLPRMRRIVSFLNEFLVPLYGENLVLDYDNPVPTNEELDIKKRQAGLGNAPYLSVNEVRDEMGLQPVKGGENVMTLPTAMPLGMPVEPKKRKEPSEQMLSKRSRIAKHYKQQETKTLLASDMVKSITSTIKKAADTEQLMARWKAFVTRLTPFEKQLKEGMSKYAIEMGKRVIGKLREQSKAISTDDLFDPNEEMAAIIDIVTPVLTELMRTEGEAAAETVGSTFDPNAERVSGALSDSISLMSDKYTQETRDLLAAKLQEGLDAGDNIDELSDSIQEVADFSSEARADRVARTETYRVGNIATKEAWQQSGVVQTLMWYTADDESVCEFCGQMDGEVVAVDENWFDKGDTLDGTNGGTLALDYADVETPPLHANCRCYIRPEDISIEE